MMKRMSPGAHFRVDKILGITGANTGNVCVVIYESIRIDVFVDAFHQITGLWTQPILQLFWLVAGCPAEAMD
jgi:hypothetical protein